MVDSAGSFDHSPISEGMQYGPFAPPEQDANPEYAQKVMERAMGDNELYQLHRLRDSLIEDYAEKKIDKATFDQNWDRLNVAIEPVENAAAIKDRFAGFRQAMIDSRRDALQRHRSVPDDPS